MVDVMDGQVTATARKDGRGAVISVILPRPPAGKLH